MKKRHHPRCTVYRGSCLIMLAFIWKGGRGLLVLAKVLMLALVEVVTRRQEALHKLAEEPAGA